MDIAWDSAVKRSISELADVDVSVEVRTCKNRGIIDYSAEMAAYDIVQLCSLKK